MADTSAQESKQQPKGISSTMQKLLGATAIIALCACGGISVWQQQQAKNQQSQVAQHALDLLMGSYQPTIAPTATGSYLAARYATVNGEAESALRYIDGAIKVAQDSDPLVAQAYRLSLFAGEYSKALDYAERLPSTYKDSLLDPSLLRTIMAMKAGNAKAAEKHMRGMSAEGVAGLFLPFVKSWVDLANHAPVDLQPIIAMAPHVGELKPVLYYQIALLLDAMGDTDQAAIYYEKLAKKSHHSHRMSELLVDFYQRRGDEAQVKALKEHYMQEYGVPLVVTSGKQPIVSEPKQGLAEVFYGVGSVLYSLGALHEAQVPLNLALELEPNQRAIYFLFGNLYEKTEMPKEAIEAYAKVQDDSLFGLHAKIRQAYLLGEMKRYDKAYQLLGEVAKQYPSLTEPLLTKGDILRGQEQYKQAVSAYTSALEKLAPAQQKHWPIYYARGIAFERAGQWQKAEDDFLEALRLQPDQPDVLNYLGYSWLIQNKHITRAKEMIEKAMVARPQDAHIVDSMGWALYHLQEYSKALGYLEQAADLAPRDPTVNEHLGDAYWQLGYALQARYQWERALLFDPQEPGQEEAIRQKIAQGVVPSQSDAASSRAAVVSDTARVEARIEPNRVTQ